MTNTIMLLPLLLGLGQDMPSTNVSMVTSAKPNNLRQYLAEKKDDRDNDPGKDITDDPHGPNPHGRDPHEEIHDKSMPANDLDPYGNKQKS